MFWQENGHKDVPGDLFGLFVSELRKSVDVLPVCTGRKTTLCQFFFRAFSREDALHCVGMESRIVYFSGKSHRCRSEVLHLFKVEVKTLRFNCKFCRICLLASWMRRYEIWNQLLSQTISAVCVVEYPFELMEKSESWFPTMLNTFDDVCSGATLSRPLA